MRGIADYEWRGGWAVFIIMSSLEAGSAGSGTVPDWGTVYSAC